MSNRKKRKTGKQTVRSGINWTVVILGVAFGGMGIAGLTQGLPAVRLVLFELPHWEKVPATILEARIDEKSTRSTKTGNFQDRVYVPRIRYRYAMAGKEYTRSQVRPLEVGEERRADAQAILDRFPVGAEVKAYVNPDDPSRSVLDKGGLEDPLVFAAGGGLFTLIGIAFLVGTVVTQRRSAEKQQ